MTLFKSVTHQEIWIEHHCERCFHYSEEEGRACPILARALTTGRKPKQWDRNTSAKAQLMKDTIRCNEETRIPPKLERTKHFEDEPMFEVEPHEANYVPVEGLPTQRRPLGKDTDHA